MNYITLLAILVSSLSEELQEPVDSKEAILYGIMCVESGGRSIGRHPDGRSNGLFGMTNKTAKWMGRKVGTTPKEQYDTAEAYLDKMQESAEGDLVKATGWYHSRTWKKAKEYEEKVLSINPKEFPEATRKMKEIIKAKKEKNNG